MRQAVKALSGLGFPVYDEGLPGYYVLDISENLPRNRDDLKVYVNCVRQLDKEAQRKGCRWHVDERGNLVYFCIPRDKFDRELYDLKPDALVFLGRTKTSLRRYKNQRGDTFCIGRNELIRKEEE